MSIDEKLHRVLYEHRNDALVGRNQSLLDATKQVFADYYELILKDKPDA